MGLEMQNSSGELEPEPQNVWYLGEVRVGDGEEEVGLEGEVEEERWAGEEGILQEECEDDSDGSCNTFGCFCCCCCIGVGVIGVAVHGRDLVEIDLRICGCWITPIE